MNRDINIDNMVKQILDVMDVVKKSGLSVRKYFSTYDALFSRKQLFKLSGNL